MHKKIHAVFVSATTIITFIFTLHPNVQPFLLPFLKLYALCSIFGFIYYFWTKKKKISTITNTIFVYIISVTILFVVGLTQWFYSPFMYLLFLLAIMYGFIFSRFVTLIFSLTLIALFVPYMQTVPLWFSFMMILSFLVLYPLTRYLQDVFLISKQSEKKVLILDDGNEPSKDTAEEYLHNKISAVATQARQHTSDIKQLASYGLKTKSEERKAKMLSLIMELSDNLLRIMDAFEEKTTGRKMVRTKDRG